MPKQKTGPLYVMLAALLWSFAGVGAKYIPWHPLSISCVRGAVAAITIACMRRQQRPTLTKATIAASLCMFATSTLFMFAIKLTSSANAIVLQYTAPVYVLIATTLVKKSRFRPMDIGAVLLTLTGIVFFFVDHMGKGAMLGNALSLLSGMTFACVFFINSLPSANPQDASLIGCALSFLLLPMLLIDKQVVSAGWLPWFVAILLGSVQLGLAYYFFSKGVQQTGAITSSIICTAEPILNPLWVFLVMNERPGTLSIIGGIIVIITICTYNILSVKQPVAVADTSAAA